MRNLLHNKNVSTCCCFIYCVCFLLCSLPVHSQDISFTRVVAPKDSPFELISGITQDTLGYMWFTSGRVLYRYNGYDFVTYKNEPHNLGFGGERPKSVFADKSGFIWVGDLAHGLDKLDPQTGIFTHYLHSSNDTTSLSNNSVYTITEDHEGYLWIGTAGGLNRLDKKTGKFTCYKHDRTDPTSLSDDRVHVVYEDLSGTIWVGTGSAFIEKNRIDKMGGLNRFDRKTRKFIHYLHDPNDQHSLIDNRVTAIYEDSAGVFWIGTAGDGLHTMDRATGKFERHRYDAAHPEKLSRSKQWKFRNDADDHITFIKSDVTGAIWIGTLEGGLSRYDPKTKLVARYRAKSDPDSLHEAGVSDMYSSRDGTVWISSTGGNNFNLYKIDPLQKNIPHFAVSSSVNAIYEDRSGLLWLGTLDGMFQTDRHKKIIRHFVHDPLNDRSISDNDVGAFKEDIKGVMWVGTGNGLNIYDSRTQTFRHYKNDPAIYNSINNGIFNAIVEDSYGDLWLGTSSGLDLMDRRCDTFTHYINQPGDSSSLSSKCVTYICEDRRGNFWIGTWFGGGINLLNRNTRKFKRYMHGKNISCIYEDSDGHLWVGTEHGLYRYDKVSDVFSVYNNADFSLGALNITSIMEDDQMNLWISSKSGISKLNVKRNEISVYGFNEHIHIPTINYLAGYKLKSGELLYGDEAGYYAFFPGDLISNNTPPQLLITDFTISDHVVKPGRGSVLKVPLEQTKEIRLSYDQNVFSFSFAAIHYINPEENRHLFMLENYDNNWRQSGNQRTAYYINVPPGNYLFRVKAAGSNGLWVEKSIRIIITPPWWRTWWFYTLCVLAVTASLYILFRYRLSQKMKAYELRNTISRDLHDEVGSTLSSIGFLSSMALEDVNEGKDRIHYTLNSINESANKMLDAMNDIIWNIQPQNDTLSSIVIRMRTFAAELLEAKKITLCFKMADNLEQLHLGLAVRHDFLLIYKEAVNNLAKYSAASSASISVDFRAPYLILTIRDNGSGFDPQKITNGNGLKNMRSRAKKIGALYDLNTKIGAGTTIILQVRPT